MTRRKISPVHDLWHRRIEGQIHHTVNEHPEWFRLPTEDARSTMVNSLAKRIVGEIVSHLHGGSDARQRGCELR